MTTEKILFDRVALIGAGLIGSSLGRAIRQEQLAKSVAAYSRRSDTRERLSHLGIVDNVAKSIKEAVDDADLIIISVPVGASEDVAKKLGPHIKPGAIVTDTGSVKEAVIRAVVPHLPNSANFVPGHPIAGTENSGPEAGFASLFEGRWCVITPTNDTNQSAIDKVTNLWQRMGSKVDIMSAAHHDKVLAITSHIPHLIAFNIVGTVADLEDDTKMEAVKYAAGGFRDFTRIAASDPEMWRDVFMENREAVLEMLGRFSEDLSALQRAIRRGDANSLETKFTRTRDLRRRVIDAEQA
ncbi:MAG: cyclohexadienyl dehydrogenase [Rhodospirillaceae bacterium]|nr:cyclohexadienyl dehydrogenase [Rhodospirillaceae bacterium]